MTAARLKRDPLLWLGLLFLALLFGMGTLRPFFAWAFPATTPAIYPDASYFTLWASHLGFVALSSALAAAFGLGFGIIATRPWGGELRVLLETVATIGQTFPPVAILALAVPAFGYGPMPTLIALTLYGILPVLRHTIAGLSDVDPAIREAGKAMGLTPAQLLRQVELPLAAPTILAGIRISVIVNIGTATIGSTVGALTLGNPIIGGLVTAKIGYVVQGAVIVGLFAIVTDLLFERLDRRLRRFAQRD